MKKLMFLIMSALSLAIPMLTYADTLPEKCWLIPVNGRCKAMIDKYYFDQNTGKCTEYTYDGCGPVVPFNRLDECRALCETANSKGTQMEPQGTKPSDKRQSGLRHDPVEDDPRFAEAFKTIDDEVKVLLTDHPQRGKDGFFNIYWDTKKTLLKQKHGIDWRTPQEMNPGTIFD